MTLAASLTTVCHHFAQGLACSWVQVQELVNEELPHDKRAELNSGKVLVIRLSLGALAVRV